MSALTKDLALNLQKSFLWSSQREFGNKANKQENKLTNIQREEQTQSLARSTNTWNFSQDVGCCWRWLLLKMLFLLPLPLSLSLLLLLLLSHVKLNFVAGNTIIDLFVSLSKTLFQRQRRCKASKTTIFLQLGVARKNAKTVWKKRSLFSILLQC